MADDDLQIAPRFVNADVAVHQHFQPVLGLEAEPARCVSEQRGANLPDFVLEGEVAVTGSGTVKIAHLAHDPNAANPFLDQTAQTGEQITDGIDRFRIRPAHAIRA